MKSALKKAVVGTPLEPLARRAQAVLQRLGLLHRDEGEPIEDVWLTEILRRSLRPDSSAIDVGCSVGQILAHMVQIAPSGRHIAFEPLPHRAEQLRRDFPQVEIFNMALSDTQGTSEFHHVVDDTGYSGLKRRQYPSDDMRVEKITVRVERLDDVAPERNFDFLKIDVEGAELQVLRGAVTTIRRCRMPVAFEHGPGASEYYGTTPGMLYDFVTAELDYHISLFPDWLEGRPPLSREQFIAEHGVTHWNFLAHP
jgi:FkbM family methyltransferase